MKCDIKTGQTDAAATTGYCTADDLDKDIQGTGGMPECDNASAVTGAVKTDMEEQTDGSRPAGDEMPVVTVIAEPDAEGQRINRAVIEFAGALPDPEDITVVNRTVTSCNVDGNKITLELSRDDKEAFVIPPFEFKPGGPDGRGGDKPHDGSRHQDGEGGNDTGPHGPKAGRKRRPISVEVNIPGYSEPVPSTKIVQPVIDDFVQYEYKGIPYNLFIPSDCDPDIKYPLIVFIPDAGPNGDDPLLALAQGIGGVCWAYPEEQKKHPCYVMAIQIPTSIHLTNDEYTVAPEFSDIWDLINKIADEKNVDRDRIYATGQSQGCMTFCEMNLQHPDFFAASMLISGHWDIDRMSTLTASHFLFGLSEGGKGEYPCFNAITDHYMEAGVDLAKVRLNFRDGWEINEAKVREAIGDPASRQMVYIIFDEATSFPDDGKERAGILYHQRGWELTYQLESARDWLFSQHRGCD